MFDLKETLKDQGWMTSERLLRVGCHKRKKEEREKQEEVGKVQSGREKLSLVNTDVDYMLLTSGTVSLPQSNSQRQVMSCLFHR